jgi:dienelactone hydrolase
MGGPGAYSLSVAAEEAGGERSAPQTLAVLVPEPARPYEELAYPSDGLRIKGYLYRPPDAGPAPAIVFNHGSRRREELSQAVRFEWLAYRLARLGYVVFVPERRGYAGSEGQGVVSGEGLSSLRNGLPGEVQDVTAAVGFLAGRPEVDAARIGLVGKSLGGLVSLQAAAEERRVRAVASLAGGYGFGDRTTGLAAFYVEQALRDAAKRLAVPVLLLHAENDRVVPVSLSRTLHRDLAARGAPVTFKEYPPLRIGGKDMDGHRLFDGVGGLRVFWKDLTDFLADTLGPTRRTQ